jgi:hypothetical protein
MNNVWWKQTILEKSLKNQFSSFWGHTTIFNSFGSVIMNGTLLSDSIHVFKNNIGLQKLLI